jgi:hypothetical protein
MEVGEVGVAGREGLRDYAGHRDAENYRCEDALNFVHDAPLFVESVSSEDALN